MNCAAATPKVPRGTMGNSAVIATAKIRFSQSLMHKLLSKRAVGFVPRLLAASPLRLRRLLAALPSLQRVLRGRWTLQCVHNSTGDFFFSSDTLLLHPGATHERTTTRLFADTGI
jgi:hypothetical protein